MFAYTSLPLRQIFYCFILMIFTNKKTEIKSKVNVNHFVHFWIKI